MSHPFTLEYIMEGETSSNQIGGDYKKDQDNQEGSVAVEIQVRSSQRTQISDGESITEECQTDQVGENPEGEMEMIKEEMNITSTDMENWSFLRILRMALRHRMEIFAQEVSITGLSNLFKPSTHKIGSIIRKVVWTMFLLFGTGFMIFQIHDRISYYLSYPTIVNYRLAYNRSLAFPTVSICSEIMTSKKAVLSLGPVAQPYASVRYPPFWYTYTQISDGQTPLNFSHLDFDWVDWELASDYVSVKTKDMILQCSFGNMPCTSDVITQTTPNGPYCVSFNPVIQNYATTHSGSRYGLRLVLWVNNSDAYLIASPGVGYRVYLHDPNDAFAANDYGFKAGTSISTSVSVSLRNLTTLPPPYGDCREATNYTFTRCMKNCSQYYILSRCGCRIVHSEAGVPGPVCSFQQGYECVSRGLVAFVTSGALYKCDCPLQCHQPGYPFSISTSPLSQHFLSYMSQQSPFKGRNLTMSEVSKELVYLDVFYSQQRYLDIQTTPAYDILTLICDIGGALGLILGGTLLTVVELVQFFVQLFSEVVTSARFAKLQRC